MVDSYTVKRKLHLRIHVRTATVTAVVAVVAVSAHIMSGHITSYGDTMSVSHPLLAKIHV